MGIVILEGRCGCLVVCIRESVFSHVRSIGKGIVCKSVPLAKIKNVLRDKMQKRPNIATGADVMICGVRYSNARHPTQFETHLTCCTQQWHMCLSSHYRSIYTDLPDFSEGIDQFRG